MNTKPSLEPEFRVRPQAALPPPPMGVESSGRATLTQEPLPAGLPPGDPAPGGAAAETLVSLAAMFVVVASGLAAVLA